MQEEVIPTKIKIRIKSL